MIIIMAKKNSAKESTTSPRKEHNSQQNKNYVHELVSTITMARFSAEKLERIASARRTHRYHPANQIHTHTRAKGVHCVRDEKESHLTQVVFVHSLQKRRKFASSQMQQQQILNQIKQALFLSALLLSALCLCRFFSVRCAMNSLNFFLFIHLVITLKSRFATQVD